MNFKKLILGCLLAVFVFVGLSVSAPREASAKQCMAWNGGSCVEWGPDHPPYREGLDSGRNCLVAPYADSTPPGPTEVNIYSGPNRTGYCVTLPTQMGLWNLDSTNGWYGPWYVKGIWVGSAMTAGYVCYSQWGLNCVTLWPGYFYNYTYPTYQGSAPGWQSISVWSW